jgi:hypothetical protein
MSTLTEAATLTAEDRCDRCGAQAWIKVGKSEQELIFCAHHYTTHEYELATSEWVVIIDARDRMPA